MKSRLLSSPALTVVLSLAFGSLVVNAVLSGMEDSADSVHDDLATEVTELMQEKRALEGELAWVETDEFVEQEARNKLFLVKPGEKMVVYPEESPVLSAQVEAMDGEEQGQGEAPLPGYLAEWLRVFGLR